VPGSVALAPQDPQLISASVAENLRLGDPRADDEQLAAALRAAQLPELADQLDIVLGSAGLDCRADKRGGCPSPGRCWPPCVPRGHGSCFSTSRPRTWIAPPRRPCSIDCA